MLKINAHSACNSKITGMHKPCTYPKQVSYIKCTVSKKLLKHLCNHIFRDQFQYGIESTSLLYFHYIFGINNSPSSVLITRASFA